MSDIVHNMQISFTNAQWWARVEIEGDPWKVEYWEVLAWERVAVAEDHEGGALVAWLNGRVPVRSDQFYTRVTGRVFTGFVSTLPEGARVGSWA